MTTHKQDNWICFGKVLLSTACVAAAPRTIPTRRPLGGGQRVGSAPTEVLIRQILNDEAVRRFVNGSAISDVDASMASDFKVYTERAVRRAIGAVR